MGERVLLVVAAFGFFVPNGLFFFWLFTRASWDAFSHDPLAIGLTLDAFLTTGLLAAWIARHPMGRFSWRTFLVLALAGGLGFALPFFVWLNRRQVRGAATKGADS